MKYWDRAPAEWTYDARLMFSSFIIHRWWRASSPGLLYMTLIGAMLLYAEVSRLWYVFKCGWLMMELDRVTNSPPATYIYCTKTFSSLPNFRFPPKVVLRQYTRINSIFANLNMLHFPLCLSLPCGDISFCWNYYWRRYMEEVHVIRLPPLCVPLSTSYKSFSKNNESQNHQHCLLMVFLAIVNDLCLFYILLLSASAQYQWIYQLQTIGAHCY